MQADVYHLYHSGAAVLVNDSLLVFDYYRDKVAGDSRSLENGVISPEDIENKDGVYVFVSHGHHDHFNRVIFDWQKYNSNIQYFLGSDIKQKKAANIHSLDSDDEVVQDSLTVQTLGSTDRGVSFLVNINGLSIFHSGDLNWWKWKSYSPEEQKVEEDDYKKEVHKLKDKDIDIAFVPVDPRLEENCFLAAEYFIEIIGPQMIIPIHFNNKYSITKKFADRIEDNNVQAVIINRRGEKIIYDY